MNYSIDDVLQYVEEEDVQDLLAAGALGFMRKPYRLRDLARKIRDILDK